MDKKINTSVIGSNFELSLRLLLLLSKSPFALDEKEIATFDFITTYAEDFNIDTCNLNGHHKFRFSEFPYRVSRVKNVLKTLVINKLIIVSFDKHGFLYSISDLGQSIIEKLNTKYSNKYLSILNNSLSLSRFKIDDIYENIINNKLIDEENSK